MRIRRDKNVPRNNKTSRDINLTRRNFLGGHRTAREQQVVTRPPWSSQQSIESDCTSCGACIVACPQSILTADSKGRPRVQFSGGECTFCTACVQACEEDVFNVEQARPWDLKAQISDTCLLKSGTTCQICTDNCAIQALRFDMRVRPAGAIELDVDACTGCGACLASCPVSAITVSPGQVEVAAA